MKSSHILIIGILTLVFCNSPTKQTTEDFKAKILNNSDECMWYFSSYTDSTEKYAVLTDSVNSEYDIVTTRHCSSRTMTYNFTRDSAFMDYRIGHSSWLDRCGPYIINGSDTIPGDSVVCAHSVLAPLPAITHEKGTWSCDAGNIYFHCTGIAFFSDEYYAEDTLKHFPYSFSANEDTLYIGNDGIYSGYVKK
jgi:hypothetical protein